MELYLADGHSAVLGTSIIPGFCGRVQISGAKGSMDMRVADSMSESDGTTTTDKQNVTVSISGGSPPWVVGLMYVSLSARPDLNLSPKTALEGLDNGGSLREEHKSLG